MNYKYLKFLLKFEILKLIPWKNTFEKCRVNLRNIYFIIFTHVIVLKKINICLYCIITNIFKVYANENLRLLNHGSRVA
jgi:hypothetical protein